MSLISWAHRPSSWIRTSILVVTCACALSLSACSDNKGNDVTTGKVAPAQSAPVQNVQSPQAQSASSTAIAPSASSSENPCGSLVGTKCIGCHSTARVCEKLGKKSKSRWKRTINRMIDRGAKINTEEAAAILDCLDSGVKDLQQSVCQ